MTHAEFETGRSFDVRRQARENLIRLRQERLMKRAGKTVDASQFGLSSADDVLVPAVPTEEPDDAAQDAVADRVNQDIRGEIAAENASPDKLIEEVQPLDENNGVLETHTETMVANLDGEKPELNEVFNDDSANTSSDAGETYDASDTLDESDDPLSCLNHPAMEGDAASDHPIAETQSLSNVVTSPKEEGSVDHQSVEKPFSEPAITDPIELAEDNEAMDASNNCAQADDSETSEVESDILRLDGVGPGLVWMLGKCSIHDLEGLASADVDKLAEDLGILGRLLNVAALVSSAQSLRAPDKTSE